VEIPEDLSALRQLITSARLAITTDTEDDGEKMTARFLLDQAVELLEEHVRSAPKTIDNDDIIEAAINVAVNVKIQQDIAARGGQGVGYGGGEPRASLEAPVRAAIASINRVRVTAAEARLAEVERERNELQAAHELMARQFRTMQAEKEHGWREADRQESRADAAEERLAAVRKLRDELAQATTVGAFLQPLVDCLTAILTVPAGTAQPDPEPGPFGAAWSRWADRKEVTRWP